MEKMIVTGGRRLQGKVKIEGAKNAVLPILTASLLATKNTSVIKDVPNLADVHTINEVLKSLNAEVQYDVENNEIHINAEKPLLSEAPFDYVSKMRASILVMGSLLARNGYARVAMRGRCSRVRSRSRSAAARAGWRSRLTRAATGSRQSSTC